METFFSFLATRNRHEMSLAAVVRHGRVKWASEFLCCFVLISEGGLLFYFTKVWETRVASGAKELPICGNKNSAFTIFWPPLHIIIFCNFLTILRRLLIDYFNNIFKLLKHACKDVFILRVFINYKRIIRFCNLNLLFILHRAPNILTMFSIAHKYKIYIITM